MPRISPIQNSFGSGELSPRLYGRTDLAKYATGLEIQENFLNHPQGGVTRRPGSMFAAAAKHADKRCRVIPFVFSPTTVYLLEVGHLYIRFFRNGAPIVAQGSPVEVTTPYSEADLPGIDVRQSADVMYFFHAGYGTRRLERYGDTIWRFREVDWAPPPSREYGARPAATFQPSGTCDTVTLTGWAVAPAASVFTAADVGREIVVMTGANAGAHATITGFTDARHVTALVTEDFATTAGVCETWWKITGSPRAGATLSDKSPVGKAVTVTLDANGWRGGITGFGTDSDCGRFIVVNGGMVEITGITSATVAAGTLRGEASATTKAEIDTWTLEEALWSADNGYAESATFFEGRLWPIAGYYLAGSKSNDFENFGVGVLDDDAVIFAMPDVTALRWVVGGKALLLGSVNAEHSASGGAGNAITASNIQVSAETAEGSAGIAPLRLGPTIIFVSRSQRKLLELAFVFEVDRYEANDLLLLAQHLTEDAVITDLAYQQEPNSTIWAVRDDGVALACAYLRAQNVVAWSRQTTAGLIESVATVPSSHSDQVYWVVQRTISGTPGRYIEWLPDSDQGPGCYGALNTDCSVVYDGVATTTVTGLSHLNGETVTVVGDGAVYPTAVVAGGQITISPAASLVEVGLPYTSTLRTLRPEASGVAGSAQAAKVRWASVKVRLHQTIGLTINGTPMPFRTATTPLGEAVPWFTGDKEIENLSADEDGRITITQTQPLPATILALTGVLDIGGT